MSDDCGHYGSLEVVDSKLTRTPVGYAVVICTDCDAEFEINVDWEQPMEAYIER